MTQETLSLDKNALKLFLKQLIEIQTLVDVRCYFVGGCVRDCLLGQSSFDYDLAVDGDLPLIVKTLQSNYAITTSILGTAKVKFGKYHVDLATYRSERYVTSNGLPEIAAGDCQSDLNRRDFTINTGYVLLSLENLDKMLHVGIAHDIVLTYAHPKFYKDIQTGILRVLHDQSFIDDPSRMLRAGKYATLYHLKMDAATQILFDSAVKDNVLATYSKDRYRQIVLSYARHERGALILLNLFENKLLLRLDASDSKRIHVYFETLHTRADQVMGWHYLLLMYEYQLDYWIGIDRSLSEVAKACRDLQEVVKVTNVQQWQSRGWGYETFKHLSLDTLTFARFAVSIPEGVKVSLNIYLTETQFIKLSIDGNTLKNLGVESGKRMGELLNLLLAYKVESGIDMTLEEEIKWIESKRYEY